MHVLVTGASGLIGEAIVRALIDSGHTVYALYHSSHSVERLRAHGAELHKVDLLDFTTWETLLPKSEAVIHTAAASGHGFELDKAVTSCALNYAAKTHGLECFIYTSGTMPFGNTKPEGADEASQFAPGFVPSFIAWRPAQERLVLSAARKHFRPIVIRPGIVYGKGAGIYGMLLDLAVPGKHVRVPGSGDQHWSLVHVDDLARLYVLAAERGETGVYHGVDGNPVKAGEVGGAAGEAAGFATPAWRPWPLIEAREELGSLADGLALDQRVYTCRANALGWSPKFRNALAEARVEVGAWQRGGNE